MQLTRGNESQIPGSQSDWKGHVSCLEGIGVIFEGLDLDLAVDIPTYSSNEAMNLMGTLTFLET